MSITAILKKANALGYKLITMEGIIFYFDTDSIPQDVYFIPAKLDNYENFDSLVDMTLKNYKEHAMETYFQCMRWTMPGLLEEVQSIKYITGKIVNPNFTIPIRITACRIYNDSKYVEDLKKRHHPDEITTYFIYIGGNKYTITSEFLRPEFGVPRYFEAVLKK